MLLLCDLWSQPSVEALYYCARTRKFVGFTELLPECISLYQKSLNHQIPFTLKKVNLEHQLQRN